MDELNPADDVIRAAGGVLTRSEHGELEVLLVRRQRYDPNEWTLPKGKLEGAQTFEQAAKREVEEETGCTVEMGPYLGALGYPVAGHPKVVLFWRMTAIEEGTPHDRREVSETKWFRLSEALIRLSHETERRFLAAVLDPDSSLATATPRRARYPFGFEWFFWVTGGERSYSRLLRNYQSSHTEFQYLSSRDRRVDRTWTGPASDLLRAVRTHLETHDLEAGWHCLHAANRLMISALEPAEVQARAEVLRQEAEKKYDKGWRGAAIVRLLGKSLESGEGSSMPLPPTVTSEALAEATALRDDADENNYHKIALMADQLGVLLWITSVPAVGVILLLFYFKQPCSFAGDCDIDWSTAMLGLIIAFGILGASFSAAQAILGDTTDSRIPERVANKWVTFVRALMGGVAALAGHVLLQSGVVKISLGGSGFASRLAVAFVFGYAGERLISRLVGSVDAK